HVASSIDTDKLPAMWGRETLTTVVSSTSMKVANITETAMSQGLIWRMSDEAAAAESGDLVIGGIASAGVAMTVPQLQASINLDQQLRPTTSITRSPDHSITRSPDHEITQFRLLRIYRRYYRHPWPQLLIGILSRIEDDFHGDALHDLDEVSGRVL